VATYETEEEQIEAIKKWWKDNGQSILMGAVLGFALLFGWRAWQSYSDGQAEQASYTYEQVMALAQQDKSDEMIAAAQKLLSEQPNSTYAALTALLQAQQNVKAEQTEAAKANLQWVIDNAKLDDLKNIAQLRKARLLMNSKEFDAAEQAIAQIQSKAYEGLKNALQGDIYLAKNSPTDAFNMYELALKDESLSPQHRRWLEMKRDDIGKNSQAFSAPNVLPPELLQTEDATATANTAEAAAALPATITQ